MVFGKNRLSFFIWKNLGLHTQPVQGAHPFPTSLYVDSLTNCLGIFNLAFDLDDEMISIHKILKYECEIMQNSATEVMILCTRKDHACVELQQEGNRKNPFCYHCSALPGARKFLGLVCPCKSRPH